MKHQLWPPFLYDGKTYDLSHLNPWKLEVADSAKVTRSILVTCADHCFTKKPDGDSAPVYPGCSRDDGRFCVERYELSLNLRQMIEHAVGGEIWLGNEERYVVIKGIDFRGRKVDYAIVFSLEKISGTEFDLRMHVRSAHKRYEDEPIDTYGSARFAHLVKLAIERKKPKRNFDRNRKRPKP